MVAAHDAPDGPKVGPSDHLVVPITSDRLLVGQAVAIAALLVASTIGQVVLRLVGPIDGVRGATLFFYVDGEQRLPALYSTAVLACCALTLGYVAWRLSTDRGWWILAALLAVLAADELLAVHERSIDPLRSGLGIDGGPLYHAWVIPGAVAVVLVAVVMAPFLRRLPSDTRRWFAVSAALFVTGAIGVEMLGGTYASAAADPVLAYQDTAYIALATLEETLEMVGAALFLASIVRHIERHEAGGTVTLAMGRTAQQPHSFR